MHPPKICISFVALASLSLCWVALAAIPPMGDTRPERLRNARRDLTDALKPAAGGVGKPAPESARSGTGAGDTPQDPPPDVDADVFAQELLDKNESADFIADDIGQESATPHDDTAFLGTAEVEAGTAPPETTPPAK